MYTNTHNIFMTYSRKGQLKTSPILAAKTEDLILVACLLNG
jgi:hypothetical protein